MHSQSRRQMGGGTHSLKLKKAWKLLTCSHLNQMAGWSLSWFMIYLEGRPAWTTVYWTSTLWRVTYVVEKSGNFFASPTLAPSTGNLQWTQWRISVNCFNSCYQMNTCTVHASGTLLLDMTHLALLDSSFKRLMTSTPSDVHG